VPQPGRSMDTAEWFSAGVGTNSQWDTPAYELSNKTLRAQGDGLHALGVSDNRFDVDHGIKSGSPKGSAGAFGGRRSSATADWDLSLR
jgi:hypothetical protein